jgi:hypothetical protein
LVWHSSNRNAFIEHCRPGFISNVISGGFEETTGGIVDFLEARLLGSGIYILRIGKLGEQK